MSDFEITESVDVVKGGGGEVWFDGATVHAEVAIGRSIEIAVLVQR